jgi:hypothetical protein
MAHDALLVQAKYEAIAVQAGAGMRDPKLDDIADLEAVAGRQRQEGMLVVELENLSGHFAERLSAAMRAQGHRESLVE